MSSFDYFQQLAIGQYLPLDSSVHRLDPRARLLIYLFLIIALTASISLSGLLFGLSVAIMMLVLSRIPLRYALKSLIAPLPFLIILAVIQLLVTQSGENGRLIYSIGPIRIWSTGIIAAVRLLIRFPALIIVLNLAAFTLSSSEMIHGLRALLSPLSRIKIHTQDFVLMIQVTLRFVPLLALSAERIAKAQASRGAEWGTGRGGLIQRAREIVPLIVPLFLTTLRRAENLALAMDARAYGAVDRPTSLTVLNWQRRDTVALLLVSLAAILILFLPAVVMFLAR